MSIDVGAGGYVEVLPLKTNAIQTVVCGLVDGYIPHSRRSGASATAKIPIGYPGRSVDVPSSVSFHGCWDSPHGMKHTIGSSLQCPGFFCKRSMSP